MLGKKNQGIPYEPEHHINHRLFGLHARRLEPNKQEAKSFTGLFAASILGDDDSNEP